MPPAAYCWRRRHKTFFHFLALIGRFSFSLVSFCLIFSFIRALIDSACYYALSTRRHRLVLSYRLIIIIIMTIIVTLYCLNVHWQDIIDSIEVLID